MTNSSSGSGHASSKASKRSLAKCWPPHPSTPKSMRKPRKNDAFRPFLGSESPFHPRVRTEIACNPLNSRCQTASPGCHAVAPHISVALIGSHHFGSLGSDLAGRESLRGPNALHVGARDVKACTINAPLRPISARFRPENGRFLVEMPCDVA